MDSPKNLRRRLLWVTAGFLLCSTLSDLVQAEEPEGPVDIDVGSTRIGGPGLTKREQRLQELSEQDLIPVTEETLSPKGSQKRLPELHTIAKRYASGAQWKEACERYDQILDEFQEDGLKSFPEAEKNAHRSFYECASTAVLAGEFEKVEALLKRSEAFGSSDYRHENLRRKMLKEEYRTKLANGDIDSAFAGFERLQAQRPDDNERIWFGEQLSEQAWLAHHQKDEARRDRLMATAERVAPQSTELRRLKEKLGAEASVASRVIALTAACLVAFFLMTRYSRWRAGAKLKALSLED